MKFWDWLFPKKEEPKVSWPSDEVRRLYKQKMYLRIQGEQLFPVETPKCVVQSYGHDSD